MVLNDAGRIVAEEWLRTAGIRREIDLDEWVVMPNHIHGIVVISGRGDRPVAPTLGESSPGRAGPTPKSLGALVAGFKSAATQRVNAMRSTPGRTIWQRNYHERIVRDDNELNRIREYIVRNPAQWEMDRDNPNVWPGPRARPGYRDDNENN